MPEHENLGSFFSENKTLLKDYLETRLEIVRLQGIRFASRSIGFLAWVFITVFLLVLVLIFTGLVLGFWFSELTGSYVAGFGITTGILVLVIFLLTLFRRQLFVNPVIRGFIKHMAKEEEDPA
jgi:hypothetical protein